MATLTDIENIARTYLRDFPKFFQTSFDVVGRTYDLSHINVDSESLWVAVYTTGSGSASALSASQYSLDERNGILRLANTYASGTKVLVEGYYYEWVTPTDITSESVHIPASQRFRMVQGLLAQWEKEYERHAANLNIGFDRLEVMNLRRVSRTTNRLVPLYKQKELGDFSPMERLWPEIDDGIVTPETKGDRLREDVYIDTTPPSGATTNAFY